MNAHEEERKQSGTNKHLGAKEKFFFKSISKALNTWTFVNVNESFCKYFRNGL